MKWSTLLMVVGTAWTVAGAAWNVNALVVLGIFLAIFGMAIDFEGVEQ